MKLIIDIPEKIIAHIRSDYGHGYKGLYDEDRDKIVDAIYHGIPLDSNSEKAEVQAYFDGQAYGWEQGRKALIDDVKAEIEHMACRQYEHRLTLDREEVIEILDNIGKAESEDKE